MLEQHDAAEIFPMMDSSSFDELRADIREHGLEEPIVLFCGKVLDGRNRLKAMLFIDPAFSPETAPKMFREFDGDDPVAFVVSKNLRRRHLNESQRAIIAAKISLSKPGKNRWQAGMSTARVAKMFSVSPGHVNEAKRIIKAEPTAALAIEQGARRINNVAAKRTLSVEVGADILSEFSEFVRRKQASQAEVLREIIRAALQQDALIGRPLYEAPVPTGKRQSPIGTSEKHRAILDQVSSGKTTRQAARSLGVSRGCVQRVLRDKSAEREDCAT